MHRRFIRTPADRLCGELIDEPGAVKKRTGTDLGDYLARTCSGTSDSPSGYNGNMHCLYCNYRLTELSSSRCSECGLVFDRNDSRTYRTRPKRLWPDPRIFFPLFIGLWLLLAAAHTATGYAAAPDIALHTHALVGFFDAFFMTFVLAFLVLVGFAWGSWQSRLRGEKRSTTDS